MKTPIDHIRELGPDAVDEFEERAAIREYLGKMTRSNAELMAMRDVIREKRNG
jgi:hypothetical protein